MNETKWTPGPWKYYPASTIEGADKKMVCTVGNRHNANLISAAPELYQACEMLINLVTTTSWGKIDALEQARAAMAKARGES